jgi:hypothetical protein
MNIDLNLYDTKIIRCIECDKSIGEIDYDSNVISPICGQCDDRRPDVKDQSWVRMKIPTSDEFGKTVLSIYESSRP